MKLSSLILNDFLLLFSNIQLTVALAYTPDQVGFNLNENKTATNPLDYWGQWQDHEYHPSPSNWRMPFYTVFLDRFANGDPSNDDANGTQWEHDILSNQLRNGGDVRGLMDSFDYLQGMGIKGLYIAGMPHINEPWAADGYSPLDLTLLDRHLGSIDDWRSMIEEAHRRGMYVVMENTMATMGDLIGFEGHLNNSALFNSHGYNYVWKTSRRYHDFQPGNEWLDDCEWEYPRFWDDSGQGVIETNLTRGCQNSEFDQYGEVSSFGDYPEWERQITKFAFVQDRLREWRPDVRRKLELFSCITIAMLDVDGFRIDKALQVTLDAQGDWSNSIRQCARRFNKHNFFIPGEIVSGNAFGALYIGRGQQTNQTMDNMTEIITMANSSIPGLHLRSSDKVALDAAAFHYTVYRALTRFLGMDGVYEAAGDPPTNFVELWDTLVQTNDMTNTNTGEFDPRHLYGLSNQDVFRWPSITNVFGRSPMTSSLAWQLHGCYKVGSVKYSDFPTDSALRGCMDDSVSLDHRDPTHPVRGLLKTMHEIRQNYPVLNDGFYLQQLSNMTHDIHLPGSNGTRTETGLWSILRSRFAPTQDFTGQAQGNQSVWLVYHNDDMAVNYQFNCSDEQQALVSPFDSGTTVKNLLPPFEEYTLQPSVHKLGLDGSTGFNGCLSNLTLPAYSFKAFVPKSAFVAPSPYITKFEPGHDARLLSIDTTGERVPISFSFSEEMDCDSITAGLSVTSTALNGEAARFDNSSISCNLLPKRQQTIYQGTFEGVFNYSIELENVFHGIHEIVLNNVTNRDQNRTTNSVDHFMIRIGSQENPMVWPNQANYSRSLLYADDANDGSLWVSHKASGADQWRYSLDFGSSYTPWMPYTGANVSIAPKSWSGTKLQAWQGEHIIAQYWNRVAGSSNHYQHGDLDWDNKPPRRFPHLWIQGDFNQFGYDSGYPSQMHLHNSSGRWEYNLMTEWPTQLSLNAWGVNEDGHPDITQVYGDIDGDMILDRIPPITLMNNVINVTEPPSWPFLSWKLSLDDGNLKIDLSPHGSQKTQIAIFVLLGICPVVTAVLAVWIYFKVFYQVKRIVFGVTQRNFRSHAQQLTDDSATDVSSSIDDNGSNFVNMLRRNINRSPSPRPSAHNQALNADAGDSRRTVLIATMEYDIEDWAIKIKIGGLGVMAQLMGANLGHQNLIWVVPCVGGVDYPVDEVAEPMKIKVLDQSFLVHVQYHHLRNITYVLLDAPIFRAQSKSEPYPARMDDLDSAIYYSAWNSCIAETLQRFPVDLYHINDYHGAVAQLHLLPRTIPCCLSLHNAEFQGLWPMRTSQECEEISQIFNLDPVVVKKYVQFGDVFNLLHAAATYLQIHQNGFGAVGVSRKYGKRSWARYPIFWGLREIGSLPNPDPSDTAEYNQDSQATDAEVDPAFEAMRSDMKSEAQKWAGLEQNPNAELFVFVGRWSMQKGIDLIADVFPSIMENSPTTQLICVGPVIDLYGRFAAIKLSKMMDMYPGRVFSKPQFTALPPYIFSGADFALIPSRDEPFGLVAVEFGRKGTLGVGSRVGGLGQMPGWWYTIESMTSKHLNRQFKQAIYEALNSNTSDRAIMRAWSRRQRFPVAHWIENLETLYVSSIAKHRKHSKQENPSRTNSMVRMSFSTISRSSMQTPVQPMEFLRQIGHYRGSASQRPEPHRRATSQAISLFSIEHGNSSTEESSSQSADGHASIDQQWPLQVPRSMTYPSSETSEIPPTTRKGGNESSRNSTAPSIEGNGFQSTSVFDQISAVPEDAMSSGHLSLRDQNRNSSNLSLLSVDNIIREDRTFNLQKVNPFFTDSSGRYAQRFEKRLKHLNFKNSEDQLCIEQFLSKSEKEWFKMYRDIKLGRSPSPSRAATPVLSTIAHITSSDERTGGGIPTDTEKPLEGANISEEELKLPEGYVPPSGLKRFMLCRIGDWPIYSILLSFGQIIAANSYQITLLNGEVGEPAEKLYLIATIYLIFSIVWWIVFRSFRSIFVLSVPFLLYGLAFAFIGISPFVTVSTSRWWIQNVATGLYSAASSSGSIYFALNFGDEGNTSVGSWVYRACIIQGTQQIYVSFLWYWGSRLAAESQAGVTRNSLADSHPILLTGVGLGIAFIMWIVGTVIFLGLPDYYAQSPGKVPAFYKSLPRRKIVLWFFYAVFIQNYWLSAPYGRNWLYLWSSQHAHSWMITVMVVIFFIGIWAIVLWILGILSKRHAWFVPIFAIGLGAPRWCQMLWSTSNIGTYVPWAGSAVASTLVGRGLWLWLGVLDALQGVGFGMILLNTLTRLHIAFTLLAAQVIGSIGTILARATAPDSTGPGDVFPDFSAGVHDALSKGDFWVCLLFLLSINVLCFLFFRKEQLQKP
uniref:alpha-1,3-glucan synthase n=1 Tax=Talaromyces marneffei PM1 TaxID=1077442 RepID=A0A093V713_TALMA